MPGYYLHFAACNSQTRKNRSFLRGVEAPDILKKHVKLYGIDGAREKYKTLKTDDMPKYEKLQERILQKETIGSTNGLHYGMSSNPNVWEFWNSLSDEEKNNPFYRGYIWHLLTDAIMYRRLDIDAKFSKFLELNKDKSDLEELRKVEVKKLHSDWDKTNAKVRDTYIDIVLTPEVEELGVVQFIEKGKLYYVDWPMLKSIIDYLRTFDPLNGDMENIISTIMDTI